MGYRKAAKVSSLQEELKLLKEAAKRLQDYNTTLMDVELQAKRKKKTKSGRKKFAPADLRLPKVCNLPKFRFHLIVRCTFFEHVPQLTGARSILARTEAAY